MYFSSNVGSTSNLGQAPNQWPYTFDNVASQKPTVAKTIPLAERPTAVRATIYDKQRAWVATQDGTLHIFSIDGYAPVRRRDPVAADDRRNGALPGLCADLCQ